MKFLKKITLATSVVMFSLVCVSKSSIFAKDFKSKFNEIFNKAKNTDIIDLPNIDIENLTKTELDFLNEKLESSREKLDNVLFLSDNKAFEMTRIKIYGEAKPSDTHLTHPEDLSKNLRNVVNLVQDMQYYVFHINPKKCTHNKAYKNDEYERQAMFNVIDTAYDIGYIDFTKSFKLEEALRDGTRTTGEHCKVTLIGRLKELINAYDFTSSPIEVLINEKECKKVGDANEVKDFIKEQGKKKFEFAKNDKKTNGYLNKVCEYMIKNNIIDLTALNIDDFSEKKLLELFSQFNKIVNDKTCIIYLKDTKEFLKNEEAKAFFDKMVECIKDENNRYEITLDERFNVQQSLHLGCKTGHLVIDGDKCILSLPTISKLLLKAYNKVENSKKKERLKLKIYGELKEREDLKKMLEKDTNIEVEIGNFDKEIYKIINKILLKAYYDDGVIDLTVVNLTGLQQRGGIELVKACIENYLANNESEENIRLKLKASGKNKKNDEEIIKDFKKLTKKYGNLEVKADY